MAKAPKASMTVVRGGRVVDIKGHTAPKADVLVNGDTIVEIGTEGVGTGVRHRDRPARGKLLHVPASSTATPTVTAISQRAWSTA